MNYKKKFQFVILYYYLNSIYARFNEYLLFSKEYDSNIINIEEITDEIENEILSEKELYNRIESNFNAYNFNILLLRCGAYIIYNFES